MDTAFAALPDQTLTASGGQHVLIFDYDLYRSVGGGQTAYRRLIALQPEDTFYYFRRDEKADAPRPANTVAIPYLRTWEAPPISMADNWAPMLWQYVEARNLAAAIVTHIGRRDFDVVDTPDYSQFGLLLRPALEAEGIRVGTVALAMHGTLSDAFRGGWPQSRRDLRLFAEIRLREYLQFRAVDVRYAISDAYAEQWRRRAPLAVNRLDPLCLSGMRPPVLPDATGLSPDLVFIGRREKWKGPDLFLDLAWSVPRELYGRLLMIGPDGPNHAGVGSDATLAAMARQRGLDVAMLGIMPPHEVLNLFAGRSLLLLPSRHDTFNLTALEALTQGCPVLISERSGFAHWLRRRLPELARMSIPLSCSREAASTAATILRDYDATRAALIETLRHARLQPDLESVKSIYAQTGAIDFEARQIGVDLAARFDLMVRLLPTRPERNHRMPLPRFPSLFGWMPRAYTAIRPSVPGPVRRMAHQGRLVALATWRGDHSEVLAAAASSLGLAKDTMRHIQRVRYLPSVHQDMLLMTERSRDDLSVKVRKIASSIDPFRLDRVRLFRELARLERRRGRDLISATYTLRVMRWLGKDRFGDLPVVADTLRQHGFQREAATARALFGNDTAHRDAHCDELLRDAYARNLSKAETPLAMLDDRRAPADTARAAVIVSLYNAADKLPTLLDNLAAQSLARAGQIEVVLIDSNSPADERGALEAWRASRGAALPIAYARSALRETIQAAWNRGIRFARAPYLAFLGVDEGLHPNALQRLADKLDADPGIDWAMADSLVTNVDRNGVFDSDVMAYDRTGYRQDLVYLETCYLSWVGGLYRRSIHDRFGYYDETYRAAGDTEFKNRVMPHIRSARVPAMLGVFNNYPEERTTQHPRAEIEDLSAWYLWRSPAGMDYAFGGRPVQEAQTLLRDCLGYRKSFCGHISTDLELAHALARHIAGRSDAPASAIEVQGKVAEALAAMRALELLPQSLAHATRLARLAAVRHAIGLARELRVRLAPRLADLLELPAPPPLDILNDNRHEQHWWSWSG